MKIYCKKGFIIEQFQAFGIIKKIARKLLEDQAHSHTFKMLHCTLKRHVFNDFAQLFYKS